MKLFLVSVLALAGVATTPSPASAQPQVYNFVTIAGNARAPGGAADGTNSEALFLSPTGLAVGPHGEVFITANYTVRMVSPIGSNWVSSTLAGLAGVPGSSDGTNADARFLEPWNVAVDASSNVFVADVLNQTVRKISPAGTNWVTTTIAGLAGVAGNADGTNGDIRLNDPWGIVVDTNGCVYVSEYLNHTVRKLSPVGTNWVSSTIIQLPTWRNPTGLAIDNAGNLYVSDMQPEGNTGGVPVITRFTLVGGTWIETAHPGAVSDGSGSIAVSLRGDVYFVTGLGGISKLAGPNWALYAVAGEEGRTGYADGTNGLAYFYCPSGLAFDAAGDLYVADACNNCIRMGVRLNMTPPPPVLSSINRVAGSINFTWTAMPGLFYQIQSNTRLGPAGWTTLSPYYSVLATNSFMSVADTLGRGARFYRASLLP